MKDTVSISNCIIIHIDLDDCYEYYKQVGYSVAKIENNCFQQR